MKKIVSLCLVWLVFSAATGQVTGHVDKKTKEFFIKADPHADYRVFGYEYANISTRKMICFSTHDTDVRDNFNNCPLGAYFNTDALKTGDRIVYLGPVGSFGKMNFIAGNGRKTLFYLPKSSFSVK